MAVEASVHGHTELAGTAMQYDYMPVKADARAWCSGT